MQRRRHLGALLAAGGWPLLQACSHGRGTERPADGRVSYPLPPLDADALADAARLAVDGPLQLQLEQGAPTSPRMERQGSEPLQLRPESRGLLLFQPGDRSARGQLSLPQLQALELRGGARVELGDWRSERLGITLGASGSLRGDRVEARQVSLQLTGSGSLELRELRCERLEVLLSGSGKLKLGRLRVDELEVRMRASGDFSVAGEARRQRWHLSGSGDVEGEDLRGYTAQLRAYGSGDISLGALESLEVELYGSGDLVYGGRPQLSQRSMGSGRVRPR